jgi:hypothetical protein
MNVSKDFFKTTTKNLDTIKILPFTSKNFTYGMLKQVHEEKSMDSF